MRFKTRLILGHVTLLAVTVAMGVTVLVVMRTAVARLEMVARDLGSNTIALHRLRFKSEALVATSRGYLLTGDPETLRRFDADAARVDAMLGRVGPRAVHVERAVQDYIRAAREAAQRRTATDDPQTIVPFFEQTLAPARARLEEAVEQLMQHEQQAFERASGEARRFAAHAQTLVIIAAAIAILLSLGLTWISIRRLNAQYAREQEATELARRAVAARDEMLAVVSHDLRTPLQAIALGASGLEGVAASPPARRSLAAIAGAAAHMQHLIGELLDVAKLDGGAPALQRERCPAGELLEATASLFRERAAKAGVELSCRAEPRCAPSADRERLLQVLSNLVGNALRFTAAGGRITLTAEGAGTSTRFAVTDTGPGIAHDELPHLFERHWQGSGERRRGLGLGLYICKRIVEAHGGCIGVDTELGRGSTFWFRVPDAEATPTGARGDTSRSCSAAGSRAARS